MMFRHIYYYSFILIFFHIASSEIITEHEIDSHRYQEGKNQYELVKQRAELPAYGQCWLNTLTSIHIGCKNLTDMVQSRLSLSYLNCFLEAQQRHHYPCPTNVSIPACTKNMTEGDRASLATFFVHTQNICYFLEIKYWNQHTQKTIQSLSETSEEVVSQLEFSSRLQTDMLTRQNLTLRNQELILAQAINLSQVISSSSSNIKETLTEFRIMSQEQRNSINDVFERIAKLQSMFLGEISSLYSIVFYSMSMLVWFLFTSVPRTANARLPLFGLMSINWLVEKVIIYYKTTEVADPILGAHNDAELYELQWWCRKFHCLVGLVILIFASWRYSDINAENNVLLKQIQDFLFNARYRRRVSAVDHLSPEQSQQKEPDIQSGSSSTGYESDSSESSHTSYINESSDATYTLNDVDSISTVSSHSSWMSLRQELRELDEEAAENEANQLSSPSTSRSNQIYSSTPLRRGPVHMARSSDHHYNLRPRTTNNYFNSTVSSESPKSFFYLMKGLEVNRRKKEFKSQTSHPNPEISDTD